MNHAALRSVVAETAFGYVLCVVLGAMVCMLGVWGGR